GDAVGRGKIEATVFDGGFDPLAAFLYGQVGQAHHGKISRAAGTDVHLDLDEVRFDAIDGGAESFVEHGPERERRPRAKTKRKLHETPAILPMEGSAAGSVHGFPVSSEPAQPRRGRLCCTRAALLMAREAVGIEFPQEDPA